MAQDEIDDDEFLRLAMEQISHITVKDEAGADALDNVDAEDAAIADAMRILGGPLPDSPRSGQGVVSNAAAKPAVPKTSGKMVRVMTGNKIVRMPAEEVERSNPGRLTGVKRERAAIGDGDDNSGHSSGSDSAEAMRERIRRKRSRKADAGGAPAPTLIRDYRFGLTEVDAPVVKTEDMLHGDVFDPRIAELGNAVAVLRSADAWRQDSGVLNMFTADIARIKRDRSYADVDFSDPVVFSVIKKLMESQPPSRKLAKDSAERRMIHLRNIPFVTRAEEEAELRTARGDEPVCCNGESCVAVPLCKQPIKSFEKAPMVLRKDSAIARTDQPRLCLLCIRSFCAQMYAQIIHNKQEVPEAYTFQTHGNLVNVEGEYAIEDTLQPIPAMPFPMVMHRTNAYDVIPEGDGFVLKQRFHIPTAAECAQRVFRRGVSRGSRNSDAE